MKKLTPILTVDDISPCLPFWTDWLGFEVTTSVPQDDGLAFAILQHGSVELMYQTQASMMTDLPDLADDLAGSTTTLFIEVESLDPYIETLEAPILVPRRQTFYGMDEIWVQAPCGSIVGLAAPVDG